MAAVLYPKFKEALLKGDVDLDTADVRVIAVDTADYTYSAAHDFLDDVVAGGRVAVSGSLTGKTMTNGVFDADDTVWTSVTGDPFEAIVGYIHDGGSDAARRLMWFDDAFAGSPTTPNGQNINVQWNASGIFQL